jgi:diketogulonate reductase-like aldo/keto reductase
MRTETDEALVRLFAKTEDPDKKVVDRVAEVAAATGIPRAQVALAWLLVKPVITAPIVVATKFHHLEDALASVNVKLSAEEIHPSRSHTSRTLSSASSRPCRNDALAAGNIASDTRRPVELRGDFAIAANPEQSV